jgi:hypothetical protein
MAGARDEDLPPFGVPYHSITTLKPSTVCPQCLTERRLLEPRYRSVMAATIYYLHRLPSRSRVTASSTNTAFACKPLFTKRSIPHHSLPSLPLFFFFFFPRNVHGYRHFSPNSTFQYVQEPCIALHCLAAIAHRPPPPYRQTPRSLFPRLLSLEFMAGP